MKFVKPRILEDNTFPDLTLKQPELFRKMIVEKVFPKIGTRMDIYYDSTIRFLKDKAKEKTQNLKVNYKKLNKKLYFVTIYVRNKPFNSLIDTGAANSLIHAKLANRLNLTYEPTKMTLMTATGTSEDAILGIAHTRVVLQTTEQLGIEICIDFIVTTQLNGLDAILGA
ncbi:MAG: retroviral-like aspartic protease, partial [Planctomycetaceae bacterium]